MTYVKRINLIRLVSQSYFSTTVDTSKELLVTNLSGVHEGIRVFSLNRNAVKNALGKSIVGELLREIDDAKNSQTRVLILKSNVPGTFCAGVLILIFMILLTLLFI